MICITIKLILPTFHLHSIRDPHIKCLIQKKNDLAQFDVYESWLMMMSGLHLPNYFMWLDKFAISLLILKLYLAWMMSESKRKYATT